MELLSEILGCSYADIQRAEELISEYKLSASGVAKKIREELFDAGYADPVAGVYFYVADLIPKSADMEIYPNYLATQAEVWISEEDFEKLPEHLKRFIKNECILHIEEKEEVVE